MTTQPEGIKIVTNNHPRPVVYWYELTEKEQSEFDWILDSSTVTPDDATFFRYKGNVYCLNDIESYDHASPNFPFPGWDAYQSDSFFSGILIRYARTDWNPNEIDPDFVIVGFYYS